MFLKSSETNFDLVAKKIGAKLNNLVINSDILVIFIRILSTKSPMSRQIKIAKIWKLFFHMFHPNAHLLFQHGHCISLTRINLNCYYLETVYYSAWVVRLLSHIGYCRSYESAVATSGIKFISISAFVAVHYP